MVAVQRLSASPGRMAGLRLVSEHCDLPIAPIQMTACNLPTAPYSTGALRELEELKLPMQARALSRAAHRGVGQARGYQHGRCCAQ